MATPEPDSPIGVVGLPESDGVPACVIAAHGTRDTDGVATGRALIERVRGMLPGVPVREGYVELVDPPIAEAVRDAFAAGADRAVVVPLMLGTGTHVRDDIPEAIAAGLAEVAESGGAGDSRESGEVATTASLLSRVRYARPLGADPRLLDAAAARAREAAAGAGWELRDVGVVFLGRGAKVPEANADHVRLARLLAESTGATVEAGFIQVTRPSLPEALSRLAAFGQRRIVVAPNFLLPGLLRTWMREQAEAWAASHPDVEVRIAEVIGDCNELAAVVADRYREAAGDVAPASADEGAPVYLAGLRLDGREVLVVGAGHVADRRVPRLLEAGARVRLISPTLSVRLRGLLRGGAEIDWEQRPYAAGDVGLAWYVLACTNDPDVNAAVAAEAEAERVFCVRADASRLGTAWTPAVERAAGLTVAVVGQRDPRRSVRVRDALLRVLHD